jgi:ribosome-associated protein
MSGPIPDEELIFSYSRSAGPGGQNVNKVATKVTLHWDIHSSEAITPATRDRFLKLFPTRVTKSGEVLIRSQKHRTRKANVAACVEKLEELLAEARQRPRVRKKRKVPRAQKQQRLEAKRKRSEKKQARRRPEF